MSDGKLKDNYLCGMSSLIYIKPATMPISIFPKGLGEPIDKKTENLEKADLVYSQ